MEKIIEYYREGNLAHAYLISTNNIDKCMEVLINVIKNIFCSDDYAENCNKCSLCHLIDINSLPSLKIIEPDGSFIKKDQILELKSLFSKASQYTKDSIYVIKNCEKMNKESANTMLKFLEEPEGNLFGFFITNHKDNVLLTIQSRCQHLEIIFENNDYEEFNLDKDKYDGYYNVIKDYLYDLEVEKKELILYNKKYFVDYEKEDIKKIFQIILKIYKDVLEKKFGKNNEVSLIFLENNTITSLRKKVNLIIEILKRINYNVNLDLLLDYFVVEMDGINNESV